MLYYIIYHQSLSIPLDSDQGPYSVRVHISLPNTINISHKTMGASAVLGLSSSAVVCTAGSSGGAAVPTPVEMPVSEGAEGCDSDAIRRASSWMSNTCLDVEV